MCLIITGLGSIWRWRHHASMILKWALHDEHGFDSRESIFARLLKKMLNKRRETNARTGEDYLVSAIWARLSWPLMSGWNRFLCRKIVLEYKLTTCNNTDVIGCHIGYVHGNNRYFKSGYVDYITTETKKPSQSMIKKAITIKQQMDFAESYDIAHVWIWELRRQYHKFILDWNLLRFLTSTHMFNMIDTYEMRCMMMYVLGYRML